MRAEKYRPHGFLDDVGVDFIGLDVPTGTAIFQLLGGWISDRHCSHVIMPWIVEMAAMLLHILFGCTEKVRLTVDEGESVLWAKFQKQYAKLAMRVWRHIWQATAENSVKNCGTSAIDALCEIFPACNRDVFNAGLVTRKRKPKATFNCELGELPDFLEE